MHPESCITRGSAASNPCQGEGATTAGHTATAEAGARVLEAGGDAGDACRAAALAAWVAESPLTGPGGGGFGLVYLARDASTRVYDFFATIPSERRGAMDEVVVDFADASTQRFHGGEASCAVPGTVSGLEAIHRAHATIPWRELGAPGAALAPPGARAGPPAGGGPARRSRASSGAASSRTRRRPPVGC